MTSERTRWYALYVLCLASLMIVLDATIVNVALPSIKKDLGFTESSLAWVVNAYLLTYGGFLLLGGRLGDFLGARKLFIGGIVLFTLASLVCGLSTTQWMLCRRARVQGIGGATASAVSLALMMGLFTTAGDRAKAMGFFGFVAAGGGSIGVPARRRAYRPAQLALDLPRQRADRGARRPARAAAASRPTSRRRAAAGSTSPARSPSLRR